MIENYFLPAVNSKGTLLQFKAVPTGEVRRRYHGITSPTATAAHRSSLSGGPAFRFSHSFVVSGGAAMQSPVGCFPGFCGLRLLVLLLIALPGVFSGRVFAGTTGKLAGIVRDAETGEGLPGVNITVLNTHHGAATDVEGNYVILNLPAGTYDIAASMIGYSRLTITNVRILPDFTSRIEFLLRPQDLAGEEITIVAERPMIQKDQTMTLSVTTSEELKHLPVRGFQQAANLGAGFVTNNYRSIEGGNETSNVRGGRPGEVGVIIDGFLQNNLITGIANTTLPAGAVEEMVAITGAYDAEYGRFQSGIIQVTTKSGGDRYSGFLEYVNDRPMFALDKSHYFGYDVVSGGLGGSLIPGNNRIRFFVSSELRDITDAEPSVIGFPRYTLSLDGIKNPDPTKPDTVLFETDPDGNILFNRGPRPKNSRGYGINGDRGGSIQAKISFELVPTTLRLDVSGNYSETYRRTFTIPRTLNLDDQYRHEIINRNIGGILTYQASPTQLVDIGINHHQASRDRLNDAVGFNLADYDASTLRGNTLNNTYYDDALLWDIGSRAARFPRRYRDDYWSIKTNYVNQVNKNHQFKIGADAFLHTVRFLDDVYINGFFTTFNGVGWMLDGTSIKTVHHNDLEKGLLGPAHPFSLAAYVQDKAEYEGLVIRAGLRYDQFNSGIRRVRNFDDPLGQGDPDQIAAGTNSGGRILAGTLGPEDYSPSVTERILSPRFSISFPVSEKSQFRLSYGKFVQQPNLEFLYIGPRALEDAANGTGFIVANSNMKMEKTTQYEVGLTRVFNDLVSVDVSAFYKDIADLVSFYQRASIPNSFAFFDNADDGVIKGLSLSVEMRRRKKIQGRAAYTFQSAVGSGASGYASSRGSSPDLRKVQIYAPLAFDRRHTMTVNLDIRNGKGEGPSLGDRRLLENSGLNILLSAGSGLPYTRTTVSHVDVGRTHFTQTIGRKNSSRMPWNFRVDLKADKTVYLRPSVSLNIYVQFLNVFDRRNVIDVWSATGLADEDGFLETPWGQSLGTRELQEHDVWLNDGFKYDTPRQVRFGLILNF